MIHYKKDVDNIVTLTLDMQGRNVNVINHEIREAFVPVLHHLQEEKKKGLLRGVILTSAKRTFLAGGDLEYLYQATNSEEVFGFAQAMKAFLRDLERPGVPVVAALNGSALGAGFEVALACHHRIALNHHRIQLGFPEVEIGLIPGGGGIIRLMWFLGIEKAFYILTNAHRYTPEEALKVDLIDELADSPKDLLAQAKAWLLANQNHRPNWDKQDSKIPGGSAKNPTTAKVIRNLTAELSARTHNNYPALQAILNVMADGSKVDFDTACRMESRYYTEVVLSQACKNMIRAFWFDQNEIDSGAARPKGFGKFRPQKIGIIGAGIMGSGIAFSALTNGLTVVIKDVSKPIADRGRELVEEKLDQAIGKGLIQEAQKTLYLERLSTTDTSKDFETCDLVIEAVFENKMVKEKVTREAEQFIDEYAFFATNTTSIPITELGRASSRPENYIGLHFFHPVDTVPLVEIVKGAKTSDETTARAFDFVRGIGKTPIIVKDDWGFYAARVRNTYILEGITLLQEGYPPALIENLGRQAGMPKGALEWADELGLDMVLKYEQQAAAHYGPKYIQHPAVEVLQIMIDDLERYGARKKAGFYTYQDESKALWTGLTEHFPIQSTTTPNTTLQDRFLFAQVIEAIWCMQEKVILSKAAANLGSIYGWGFPAFKGGVFQYIIDYDPELFIERSQQFQIDFGQRFQVPKLFHKLV
ncbi:MAG: 3-hydroxyacyl-CoA dehydrogenase NAD-binding domain-containing protein [Bacteroidota bacterium]